MPENGATIMIVDDSSTSRMITKRCFGFALGEQFTFMEATDGANALSQLQDDVVDLIVTDINMPKMDGTTFVWKIRMSDQLKRIPVVVLSSMKNDALKATLRELGVEQFVQKPVSPVKVGEVMEVLGWR